ncbi:MAG: aminotransferase class V-fold PLP-dependent enzyme [Anaerolineae bacterium]|nr:aminotransferase class V-fold PLP-dependent enzyme [Anaerolineae bacterium]
MIDLTPDRFRELAHRAVEMIAGQLDVFQSSPGDAPARNPLPEPVRERLLRTPPPESPRDPAELLDAYARDIQPYPMGNNSPRFFGWVNSPAAPMGILAEMLAAALNPSVAGGDHAATYVEHAVLSWLKAMVGFPGDGGAILVSGGSMANLVGLAAMRHAKTASGDVRGRGLYAETAPLIVYTSTQGHSCIEKAVEILGLGHDNLRKIPVDADFRMDLRALQAQIEADRRAGLRPACVAASAGTVNSGAVDPLAEIADLCAREGLWFHVDGAYGAPGVLAESARAHFAGMDRADSLALDPHKWLYVPIECGCAFVRDAGLMRDTFSLVPPYLRDDRILPWFSEFGPQQTRGFRALKLWLTMQQVGLDGYRALIEHDIQMAKALQAKIRARPDFALVAAGPLSVTCFRFAPPDGLDAEHVDALNRDLLALVQREGRVFLTSAELNGRFVLRACIVNFRTCEDDLDVLLDTLADAARRVRGGMG